MTIDRADIEPALIRRLDSDPAWERIYADDIAVIHRRR